MQGAALDDPPVSRGARGDTSPILAFAIRQRSHDHFSQTPYRVSFAGGGTDLPAFYRRAYGAVLSATIDQHIYVTIGLGTEVIARLWNQ
jgi:hypothetical protein